MFFIKFGLFKVAISNSLLEYIGYDVDEFCVETIKYRTVMFELLLYAVFSLPMPIVGLLLML